MIRKQLYLLYIIICVLSLLSCADNTHEEALCQAETLMDAEQYEEAYALLDSLDGSQFHPGSHQQARYALLYTKVQYKNYIISPSDSLISLCVDYAEAEGGEKERFYAYLYQGLVRYELCDYSKSAQSMLRALANSGSIDDHYAKGQMFSYLALVNGIQHCSDEVYYAERACEEYDRGGLGVYYANAKTIMAVAKIHQLDYDSVQVLLDEAIICADSLEDSFSLNEALSAKAQYAISIDSFHIAAQIYDKLLNDSLYSFQCKDYCNLALLHAKSNNADSVSEYLSFARQSCANFNDSLQVLVKAVAVYEILGVEQEVSSLKDSLLLLHEQMIAEGGKHTSMAFQRDYSEWQLAFERTQHRQKKQLLLSLFVCFLLLCFVFLQYYRRKSLQVQLQTEKIEKLQLQIKQHEQDMAGGLQIIKSSELVGAINKMLTATGTPHVDWDRLYALYCEKLPLFEKTLRELSALSEIEWRVCMLLKLGFLPGQIAVLTSKSAEGISSIRRRLYYKVFQKKGKAADWDKFIEKL